jgi:hypothetical protein
MRRAVVCGCAMGSFAVERFSVDRFFEITEKELNDRIAEFRQLVAFEQELVG